MQNVRLVESQAPRAAAVSVAEDSPMRRGLKADVSLVAVAEYARFYVAEDSPMRRGLKAGCTCNVTQSPAYVAEDSPMRRGLKARPWHCRILDWTRSLVAEDSPMRRGLKVHYGWHQ